jgi:hypothetical protein
MYPFLIEFRGSCWLNEIAVGDKTVAKENAKGNIT